MVEGPREGCEPQRNGRKDLSTEVVHADVVVVATGNKAAITKTNAVDRGRVAFVGVLAGRDARVPDFDHTIHATRGDAQSVPRESPDTLQMAEESAEASTGVGFPQTNGSINTASDDVTGGFLAVLVLVKR